MDSDEIVKEIPGFLRVYKDGGIQRFMGTDVVPAGIDPSSGVHSKDVLISPENNLSARLYFPKTTYPNFKLPLFIFYHGGGFVIESAASPTYHRFLNLIVAESNIVVVSVDYRRAPEYFLPVCYEDSWEAIKWVAEHANGQGPEPWLNDYADLRSVYFGGDSAGGNIAHHMAIRVGSENPGGGLNLQGLILLHPYFWGKDRIGSERGDHPWKKMTGDLWVYVHPGISGLDDPVVNPGMDPKLSELGCSRVLVYVAELDILKERGWYYKQVLDKSGWTGEVEVVEDKGENHVFFLFDPTAQKACNMRSKICTFINSNFISRA